MTENTRPKNALVLNEYFWKFLSKVTIKFWVFLVKYLKCNSYFIRFLKYSLNTILPKKEFLQSKPFWWGKRIIIATGLIGFIICMVMFLEVLSGVKLTDIFL